MTNSELKRELTEIFRKYYPPLTELDELTKKQEAMINSYVEFIRKYYRKKGKLNKGDINE